MDKSGLEFRALLDDVKNIVNAYRDYFNSGELEDNAVENVNRAFRVMVEKLGLIEYLDFNDPPADSSIPDGVKIPAFNAKFEALSLSSRIAKQTHVTLLNERIALVRDEGIRESFEQQGSGLVPLIIGADHIANLVVNELEPHGIPLVVLGPDSFDDASEVILDLNNPDQRFRASSQPARMKLLSEMAKGEFEASLKE